MFNWKNIFKSWAGIPVLILATLVIIWLFVTVAPRITVAFKSWQAQRAYDKMLEPYYKDTYGGKTPEETYDLFITALKMGDIELASKYFVIEDQEKWGKTISEYKNSGSLADFINELDNTKKIWRKIGADNDSVATFEYDVRLEKDSTVEYEGQKLEFPAGEYTNSTEFHQYPSGIWKIYAF